MGVDDPSTVGGAPRESFSTQPLIYGRLCTLEFRVWGLVLLDQTSQKYVGEAYFLESTASVYPTFGSRVCFMRGGSRPVWVYGSVAMRCLDTMCKRGVTALHVARIVGVFIPRQERQLAKSKLETAKVERSLSASPLGMH